MSNDVAISMYKSFGYSVYRRVLGYYSGEVCYYIVIIIVVIIIIVVVVDYFVDLFVRVSNDVAISMYKSFGYSVYRRVLGYYSGEVCYYIVIIIIVVIIIVVDNFVDLFVRVSNDIYVKVLGIRFIGEF